jgi:type IV pilus assembly protein PilN
MEIKLNLASKPYLNRQAVRLWLMLACTLMVVLLVLNSLYAYQNLRQMSLLDHRLQGMAEEVSGQVGPSAGYSPERYAALRSEVEQENEMVAADQFRWTALLNRFEMLLPEDVSLRSIQPDFKARSVQLTGVARDVSAMTRFVDNLLGSEDLNQAYLQRHDEVESTVAGGRQVLVGFSLIVKEAF